MANESWLAWFREGVSAVRRSADTADRIARHLRAVGMHDLAAQLSDIARYANEGTDIITKAVHDEQDRQVRAITMQTGQVLTALLDKADSSAGKDVEP